MTNEQIIQDIASNIYGEDAVISMIESGQDIPLHTVKGWAARGPFRVKKGEHGLETRLWKKRKDRKGSDESDDKDDIEVSSEQIDRGFYMAKACLFRGDQVKIVREGESYG